MKLSAKRKACATGDFASCAAAARRHNAQRRAHGHKQSDVGGGSGGSPQWIAATATKQRGRPVGTPAQRKCGIIQHGRHRRGARHRRRQYRSARISPPRRRQAAQTVCICSARAKDEAPSKIKGARRLSPADANAERAEIARDCAGQAVPSAEQQARCKFFPNFCRAP